MRITESQLRKIVRGVRSRLKGRQIQEASTTLSPRADHALATALDDIRSSWLSWAEEDPSIGLDPQGLSLWESEVDKAIEELTDRMNAALNEIEADLIDGKFRY